MKFFLRFLSWSVGLLLTFWVLNKNFLPLSQLFDSLIKFSLRPVVNFSLAFKRVQKLEEENLALGRQVLSLQERLSEQILIERLANIYRPGAVQARVIGFVLGSGGRRVFLDKGTAQGIKLGDWAIISEKTLVGQIEKVNHDYSVLKTIFDPSLKVAAEVILPSGSVARGLFYFNGSEFVLDFLPSEFEFVSTEPLLVQSSGQDGIFRAGFYLGQVTGLEESAEAQLKRAVVKPAFSLAELNNVFLLKNFFYQAQ